MLSFLFGKRKRPAANNKTGKRSRGPPARGWDNLPNDLRLQVTGKLPFKNLVRFGATSKAGRAVANLELQQRRRAVANKMKQAQQAAQQAAVYLASRKIETALRAMFKTAAKDQWMGGPKPRWISSEEMLRTLHLVPGVTVEVWLTSPWIDNHYNNNDNMEKTIGCVIRRAFPLTDWSAEGRVVLNEVLNEDDPPRALRIDFLRNDPPRTPDERLASSAFKMALKNFNAYGRK